MHKLLIFGDQDIARLAGHYFSQDSPYEVAAYCVDAAFRQNNHFEGLPLVDFESIEQHYPPREYSMFVAVSYRQINRFRAQKFAEAKAKGYTLANYISSKCTWLSQFQPGENCFILEDNTIQPFVRIGANVTLWSGNHIGHDSIIEDDVFITSQVVVSGRVRVGRGSFIGVNASLAHNIHIGAESLIGAGAVITQDSEAGSVYVPPRALKLDKRSHEVSL